MQEAGRRRLQTTLALLTLYGEAVEAAEGVPALSGRKVLMGISADNTIAVKRRCDRHCRLLVLRYLAYAVAALALVVLLIANPSMLRLRRR